MDNERTKALLLLFSELAAMRADRLWDDGSRAGYLDVVRNWEEPLLAGVVRYLKMHHAEGWRPSPAELCQIAVKVVAPVPATDAVYAEIVHLADAIGLYCQRHEARPNLRVEGTPVFSSHYVEKTVERLGGWRRICCWNTIEDGSLINSVRRICDSLASEWRYNIVEQLALPIEQRNPIYFTKPAGRLGPSPLGLVVQNPLVLQAFEGYVSGRGEQRVAMPDDVRTAMTLIGPQKEDDNGDDAL